MDNNLSSLKPLHFVYLAICLIVLGFFLILTHEKNSVDIKTETTGNAQITILDISSPENKGNGRLFLGMGCIGLGLLIGAKNLVIKTKKDDTSTQVTPKEQEILDYMKKGHSNKEIAQLLHISPSTVKTHISNIYKKYQVSSRAELLEKLT